jgi:glycosyltransferase involved in cell wall biosynthesis
MSSPVSVSFCATNLNTVDRLPRSLDSVAVLGRALGVPFEVVVADGPSHDGARALLEERARSDATFHLVPHAERNRGYGRRKAFEASSGAAIVPFDTSIEYSPWYAEMLRGYLGLGTERMLFSEICALRRRTIETVGGWRDLVGGEDIDLYARVIARFGVIAYPTSLRDSQAPPLRAFERQMRYVQGSFFARMRRIYAVQRDQLIGANYRVRDLMGFNRRKPIAQRVALRGFFTLVALGARLRPIRPFALDRNNYLYFREAILDSVVRGDWRVLGVAGPPPQLLLTDDEVGYLERASRRWSEYARLEPPIVGRK